MRRYQYSCFMYNLCLTIRTVKLTHYISIYTTRCFFFLICPTCHIFIFRFFFYNFIAKFGIQPIALYEIDKNDKYNNKNLIRHASRFINSLEIISFTNYTCLFFVEIKSYKWVDSICLLITHPNY